jgi:hypothetical protein
LALVLAWERYRAKILEGSNPDRWVEASSCGGGNHTAERIDLGLAKLAAGGLAGRLGWRKKY